MNLNQVTFPFRNYAASVAFYRKLGLRQIVDNPPQYARFETDLGTTFSIHMASSIQSCDDYVVYFEVEDVDATVQRLRDLGLEFELDPTDRTWLWREAYTRDPFGNTICIYNAGENRRFPPWRLNDSAV